MRTSSGSDLARILRITPAVHFHGHFTHLELGGDLLVHSAITLDNEYKFLNKI